MSGRADDMLNVRCVTLFPSSIEDVVRGMPMLGPEFAIVLKKERDLDILIVQVEALSEISTDRYTEIADQVEREVRSSCELRAVIEVLPQGTLPPTQFKAKRVRDLR
jgi:phenylacetate-CoA ligase